MFGSLSHQGSARVLPSAIMAVSGLSLYVGAALAGITLVILAIVLRKP
ncbi:hypothetical protein [Corynebacterium sp. HMSC22B11]|nr:hypothetical protein [Corynebacterium sp. HMSC22B11]